MTAEELQSRIRAITRVGAIPNHPGAKHSAMEIEADQVLSLIRDVVEAVTPGRVNSGLIEEDSGWNACVTEIHAKTLELGL